MRGHKVDSKTLGSSTKCTNREVGFGGELEVSNSGDKDARVISWCHNHFVALLSILEVHGVDLTRTHELGKRN